MMTTNTATVTNETNNNEAMVFPFYCRIWFITLVGVVCAFFVSFLALIPVFILQIIRGIKVLKCKGFVYGKESLILKGKNLISIVATLATVYIFGALI